jgi:hypothetical protein
MEHQQLREEHRFGAADPEALLERGDRALGVAYLGSLLMAGACGAAAAGFRVNPTVAPIDTLSVLGWGAIAALAGALVYGCAPILELTQALNRAQDAEPEGVRTLRIGADWPIPSIVVAAIGSLFALYLWFCSYLSTGLDEAETPYYDAQAGTLLHTLWFSSVVCAFGALVCGMVVLSLLQGMRARLRLPYAAR